MDKLTTVLTNKRPSEGDNTKNGIDGKIDYIKEYQIICMHFVR